jgi:hypothetical protein
MMSYLLTNNIISKHQHGFLARHSTSSNLLECLHDWTMSLEFQKMVDVVYIDFSRAFDSVVHSKLLFKLRNIGIGGNLYKWISQFLTARSQCTVVENEFSAVTDVISGVIQGSCLGPLLFLLFINDIDSIINCGNNSKCKLYADDLKLYSSYTDSDCVTTTQCVLDRLHSWSVEWQLSINYSKCRVLHMGSKNGNADYFINGTRLMSENNVNDLGVLTDSDLRFNEHINRICTRAHSRVSLLFRGFVSRDPHILVKAYKVYVRPLLEYCCVVWSPWQIGLINAIENVQRYFTRRLIWPNTLPYCERLAVFDLELLELRRIKCDMYYCYKILNNLTALDSDYFTFDSRILNTRHYDNKLLVRKPFVNNCTENLFFNRCVPVWNELPINCRTANSFKVFKNITNQQDFNKHLKGHV